MAELSTEQVLLLNNLMYMTNQPPLQEIASSDAGTVEDYINKIAADKLQGEQDYGSYMTGDDWKNLINAVKNDEQLMNMQIAETHVSAVEDGVGGGVSAVFVDPDTDEAVVVFRGTGSLEWKDNFVGGGPTDAADGVSTRCQEEALAWYQSLDLDQYSTVTVTGHSKGGNKAKYITVMDDSVDRCLSFDGQGFSDEFVGKYQDEIARNQGKITNSNVDSDYVNLLLNDIGQTDFYEGFDYGDGAFLENHCPNTFFDFKEDGSYQMVSSVRDERMEVLDEFLNNYLRTLSPEEKQETLEMIGELVEGGFNGASVNDILDIFADDKNMEYAADLIAYTMEYKKQKTELVDALKSVLEDMGMDNVTGTVDTVVAVTEWKYFSYFADGLGLLAGHIPDFAYDLLQKFLETKGITLTKKELRKLAEFFQFLAEDMDTVVIADNGADLGVTSGKKPVKHMTGSGTAAFYIHFREIRQQEENLREYSGQLLKNAERMETVIHHLDGGYGGIKATIGALKSEVLQEAEQCRSMAEVLGEILKCYETAEKKISSTKIAANF
ncbi:MAG: DUF2974 domain-containing protein [Roseburia sp.]|nr:DUF2974 domain-containing protein [Roseburia sp.]